MIEVVVVATVVFAFALVSRRLEHTGITSVMVFVTAGIVLGPSVTGVLDIDVDSEGFLLIAEVTLVLILFTDAARVRHPARGGQLPARLLGIGMPLTIVAGLAIGLLLLGGLEFWEVAVVAVILAPTDAALGEAVVTSPRLPARIRQALNVESGLNDGLSVPLLTLFVALAAAGEQIESAGFWAQFALEQIGFGVLTGLAVGAVGGWLVARAMRRGWMTKTFQQLAMLALALGGWALAGELDGNGFIAAFVAGLAFGHVCKAGEALTLFAVEEGDLLTLSVFFLFGATVAPEAIEGLSWQTAAYAVLSLTAVRMLPVAIALIGTHLRRTSVLFLGWFGPRGLASIILALIVLEEEAELAGTEQITLIMGAVVLLSVFAHGLTAAPLTDLYARHCESLPEHEPEMHAVEELPTRKGHVK
ncbi:MAG: sodium:proton exchanger [Solirubrobacterales bacterium]|nr:sodium:proton exchanger [Solirubrobacterales bacterium]